MDKDRRVAGYYIVRVDGGDGEVAHVLEAGPGADRDDLFDVAVDAVELGAGPTGITAVAINLTATAETASGFLITYPDGATRPTASGLQFTASTDIAQMAIVPVATNGKIDIFNTGGNNAAIDLLGDVVGYFTAGTSGEKYHAVNASRMLDTRIDNTPLTSQSIRTLAQPSTVSAAAPTLVTNITVTDGTGPGYLTFYPDGTTRPTTSNINWAAGQTIAALALPAIGNGSTDIYAGGPSTVNVIIDCNGYFATN